MRTIKPILLTLVLITIAGAAPQQCHAQQQNNIWYFGENGGIDFNTTPPTTLTDGQAYQEEGTACYSDPVTGRLIFYTDGITVWNRNHQVMANGTGLDGHRSSTQSALIIPFPRDNSKFYVFTAGAGMYQGGGSETVRYSIIDINANGGVGEVLQKNVSLLSPATEKLVGVRHCNGRDYWVLTHKFGTNEFYVFKVSPAGISNPVISATGSDHADYSSFNTMGAMKVSPNSKKLAVVTYNLNITELFDFDNKTGIVSNPVSILPREWAYGLSFSPDNTKLYISEHVHGGNLYQFDIQSNNAAAIAASRTLLATNIIQFGSLQTGPDGKIYVARGDTTLSYIEFPNLAGVACGYRRIGWNLTPGRTVWGLPNIIETDESAIDTLTCSPPTARFSMSDTVICVGTCIDFTDLSTRSPEQWEWMFEGASVGTSNEKNPRNICYNTPGLYTATLVVTNSNGDDTARLTVDVRPLPNAEAGPNVAICPGEQAQLGATGGVQYQWLPAQGLNCTDCANPIARPASTTTYTVRVYSDIGCVAEDSVTVTVKRVLVIDAGKDLAICTDGSAQLSVMGDAGTYRWAPATGLSCTDCPNPVATPTSTTTYTVTVSAPNTCDASSSITVSVLPFAQVDAGPDVFVCPGGEGMVTPTPGALEYHWSPATGLSCTDCENPVVRPTTPRTYYLQAVFTGGCEATDSVRVGIYTPPTANAGNDTTICIGDAVQLNPSGGVSYSWAPATGLSCTDCRNPVANPAVTTIYTVTVTDANGCTGADNVTITVDPAPRTVQAHIPRDMGTVVGLDVVAPVVLDNPLDAAHIDSLIVTLNYGSQILVPSDIVRGNLDSLLGGTLLEGWTMTILSASPGEMELLLTAPPGETLKGTGDLLRLRFQTFIGSPLNSELPFDIRLPGERCTEVLPQAGRVELDSICGLNFRLIEAFGTKYALAANVPNPFNPSTEIEFSLGLDGPTRLEIYNAAGQRVALLVDGYLQPGTYAVVWDATGHASGLYYYRVSSGAWSQTQRMMLVK